MTEVARPRSGIDARPVMPAVPDPPPIEGLRFRRLIVPGDAAELAELENVSNAADGVPERHTPEELANWLLPSERRDPDKDMLVAEIGGRMIGMTTGGWQPDNDGGRDYGTWGVVHPDWRRRGLGGALLRWTEARRREVAATHPGDVMKRFESWSFDQETGRNALLEANGYEPVRYWFDMARPDLDDIPDLPLPDGFEFQQAREEDARETWDVMVTAFRDHFGGFDESEASYRQHLSDPTRDLSLWVLVWHEGRIVGEALNRIKRAENEALGINRGWVNAVAVLREYRRRGLGRAIVARSLQILRDAGMTSAGLGVDAENPHGALGIYDSLGFGVVERGRIYRKPLP